MRLTIWLVGALLLGSSQGALLGCGSGESPITCDEDGCECRDRQNCVLDCGDVVGCQPSCTATKDMCSAECIEDCEFRCLSAASCGGVCADNCLARCSSADTCVVEMGANSDFQCTNVSDCAVIMGDGSRAQCLQVNTCSARCEGSCIVFCGSASSCSVECPEGVDRETCGGGLFTCGMPCS
jgi:hypothetical protein